MSSDRARSSGGSQEDLFVRYWDNALRPDELFKLNRILATDDGARVLFQQFCLQTLAIGEQFAVAAARPAPDRAPGAASGKLAWVVPAVVATLLVAVGLAWWAARPLPVIAWVDDMSGQVIVTDAAGSELPTRPQQPLRSGQRVVVTGNDGTAAVRFRDDTRLILAGDTAVQISDDGQKTVRVDRGHVVADVRPQPPGRPMTLVTGDTEVQVLGTKLSISETQNRTEVAVVRGEVRVTRLSDNESLDLRSGQVATAIKGSPKLLLAKLSELPDTYAMNFEQPPPDLQAGEPVWGGLPADSRGGLRATPYHSVEYGTQYQIRSYNAWTAGLFALHEDSWLHLRFRMEQPGFFHVLFVARSDDPTDKRGVVFEAPQVWTRRKADTWYEASVPLGQAKRIGSSPPKFPLPLVVYQIVVNSHLDDVGIVVDRLQVNRSPRPD